MPKLRPEPGPPPSPNQEASTPTAASRLSKPQHLASIALRAHQSLNLESARLEPAQGQKAPQRGATPASPDRSAALKSKRGAAPIARQRFAQPSQGNMIRIRKTQTRDKQSLAATIGNSLQRQTEPAFGGARSKQNRAVPLANHSATPSLDLEMSKRCGAKPRIL